MSARVVGSGPRRRWLVAIAAALAALAIPSAAQAVPVTNINVSFGFPVPQATTNAGDETEYTISFTAPNGLNSNAGTAVVVNAAGAALAPGTVFPPNAPATDGGAFYTLRVNAGQTRVVVAPVQLSNGGQTVAVPTFASGTNASPGDTVTLGIGYVSEMKVHNPQAPCTCRLAVATVPPAPSAPADFGVSASYEVVEGPGDLLVEGGSGQTATVGAAFASPLQAKLLDGLGNPVEGETITFAAPDSGPSGTFADGGGLTDTAQTDASGIATSSALTANGNAGLWEATASSAVAGVNTAEFALDNDPGAPADVALVLEPNVIAGNGVSTSRATATVTDSFGNPVALGQTVSFSSTAGHDISSTTELTGGRYRATITSTPEPGVFTITATADPPGGPSDTAGLGQTADETGPVARILEHPRRRTTDRRVRFSFDSNAGDTDFFECRLDRAAFEQCDSPESYRVRKGRHTFRVRATDLAGNTGPVDRFRFERISRR